MHVDLQLLGSFSVLYPSLLNSSAIVLQQYNIFIDCNFLVSSLEVCGCNSVVVSMKAPKSGFSVAIPSSQSLG